MTHIFWWPSLGTKNGKELRSLRSCIVVECRFYWNCIVFRVSEIQTSQAKIHIPATWIFALSLGNTHRGCAVDQLSRLLWRRHLRIYIFDRLVCMALHLVGITLYLYLSRALSGLPVHDVFRRCQDSGNFSTGSRGRTYQVTQTQACSILQSQGDKS